MPSGNNGGDGYPRILVLEKARDILNVFTTERPELHFKEIRDATGLPATTCMRLVRNLVRDGFLDQRGDRYRIGLSVLRWAAVATEGLEVVDVVAPLLSQLRDETGETAGFFVRDGAVRVCVALAETRQPVGRRLSLGHVLPVHAGAPGKALLAFDTAPEEAVRSLRLSALTPRTFVDQAKLEAELEAIRKRGYAVSFGEWDLEVAGVAAPVFGADHRLLGAIGVSAPASRMPEGAWASEVLGAANEASRRLGFEAPLAAVSGPT